jgi:hypothetical protein
MNKTAQLLKTLSEPKQTAIGTGLYIPNYSAVKTAINNPNQFTGTAVWEDLNFDPERSGGPVATRPEEVKIGDVFYSEFTSANNQLCGSAEELPHAYKLGSQIYPHAHIFLKPLETEGTTGVTFTIYWALRQRSGTTTGSVPISATSAQLLASSHKLDIYDTIGFAGSIELGAQLALTIARTGGDAGDVIVLTYGIHYQTDTMGSRLINTK